MPLAKTLPEQTSVHAEVWDAQHKTMYAIRCIVDHYGDEVVHVHFEEGWRHLVQAIGLDAYHEATEGFVWTLAVQAFQRGGR